MAEGSQEAAGAGTAQAPQRGGEATQRSSGEATQRSSGEAPRHGGARAVAAARRHGVATMFTLSGGHVFPLYDGAVKADPPMRLVDVRHEQTAVFAAEATARLTRSPGLAVLTAGPGVTNGISAITTSHFNGSPVVVLGGRAPDYRWGSGSLQEIDHPLLLAPVTKRAWTEHQADHVGAAVDEAFRIATTAHRGPVFLDFSLEALFGEPGTAGPGGTLPVTTGVPPAPAPESADVGAIAGLVASASRPVLVLGSDVWLGGAEAAARAAAEDLRLPVITNGQARGVLPAGHDLLATRARSMAFREADLVVVAGTPLDFRLGYGEFGGKDGAPPARVVHVADAPDQIATHGALAASAAGDLAAFFTALAEAVPRLISPARGAAPTAPVLAWDESWLPRLRAARTEAMAADGALLASDADPIHPMRIYGELARLLDEDAVVIGDGGDFVSYAGKYVEPKRPGGWLDPGPYGCLGTGLGYAIAARIARPQAQVVLLLGDGAAGFSLMDADTLVRHRLPVVMICGNNGIWGLEKHPMQALYGYDVAADLQPRCRYDEVVQALGGAGEMVTRPQDIAPALRRAFGSGVPYLVNVITDPAIAYPRSTTGI
ncbi:MAG TPA: acetolactate synthase [Streptosporangiaceae bacterium]|jgi:acetolactate synthase-1/2/3 large subunit|nr:acetolactate synthase [Streptosporangiaceae bacterium]